MQEVEYEKMQEEAAIGKHNSECMAAILAAQGTAHNTLASLQRRAYKDTRAGVAVSFRLTEGEPIWVGDARANDPQYINYVTHIGCSSIIEGSEAEVPLTWIELATYETPEAAATAYQELLDNTDEEACDLWDEIHGSDGDDPEHD